MKHQMKTIRDAEKFIAGLIQSGAPLDVMGLGEQSYNLNFIEPHRHDLWVILRIFGTKPFSIDSDITSCAISIGKGSDHFKERDRTCFDYFGRTFRELGEDLSKAFDCKIEQVSQIKCKNPSATKDFIHLLIKYYTEAQSQKDVADQVKHYEVNKKDKKSGTLDSLIDKLELEKIKEERQRVLRIIDERRGQAVFRQSLLNVYNSKCAISGTSLPDVLEAAHIIPYSEVILDKVQNGILLRSDLHVLFDNGLISINDDYEVIVHDSIKNSQYGRIDGKKIRLPESNASKPSKKALKWHHDNVFRK